MLRKKFENGLGFSVLKEPEKRNKRRIAFIQPAYAKYREPLFQRLHSHYNTKFYFIQPTPVHLQNKGSAIFTSTSQLKGEKSGANLLVYLARKYLLLSPVYLARKYLHLLLSLMKNNYSVIVTSLCLSPQTIISLLVSKIKGSRCVLWIESWSIPQPRSLTSKFRFLLSVLLKMRVLRNVDAIIVGGTPQYKYVRNFDMSDEKVFFSNHCSLDYSKFESVNLKNKLNIEGELVVLYLGRITEAKGLDILIKAFSRVEQERDDVFLTVCGEGDFRSFCERLAEELKIKHIFFSGVVQGEKEIASYYKTSDVFVLPTSAGTCERPEPWGLVINEAMSMGKPVVTTDVVGAAQDLVKNGVNGYVVKHGDVDGLYLALKRILRDKKLRKAMGKNSREIFEEFNDFEKMFEGFKKAIEYAVE